jgi:hypothetical protein
MKKTPLSIAAGAILACGSVILAPTAWAAGGGLADTWTSVDTDGSDQTLSITGSGGKAYAMVYDDDSATVCNGAPARIVGPGFVDGSDVVMEGTLVCLPGGNPFRSRLAIGFRYDAGTDTLTDSFGVVWHRAG